MSRQKTLGNAQNQALRNATIIIVVRILATTLAQTEVLARMPLQNLLKNELHLDRSANAAFFWIGLAWYLKPLVGIVTDAFPLFGNRRRSYLLIGAVLAAISWLAMIPSSHDYGNMLLVAIALNMFMIVCSTVIGGYIVETTHAIAGSGRLTATRQLVQ